MSRPTAYRMVKRVKARANIHGKQATGKGFAPWVRKRNGHSKKKLPIHILAQLMGHTDSKVHRGVLTNARGIEAAINS